MKIYRISQVEIDFINSHLNSHHGQSDFRLLATINGETVGSIDYVIYNDEVSISNIEVDKGKRRQGIGTKLLKELQRIYPNNSFEMGMFTDDGYKLWESLNKTVIKNKDYHQLSEEKEQLEIKKGKIEKFINNNDITDKNRAEVLKLGDELNSIYDRLYEIDESLYDMKSENIYIEK